ncbi:hypothetical protein DSL72_007433 [Monilinia vaccinii-corymbosi]|uniref:FAD/NAD(P)-binding domain-containing protein n=1 Tax=Monilinia vaccinii-corymbosi TaxID=61207 RepID=A0A8A3PLL1_9HELO|nr:hypothetical protein DSL72_007433 [Monilinia vaccinii-corymbosi]
MLLVKRLPSIVAGRLSTRTLSQVLKSGKHGINVGELQTPLFNQVLQKSYSTETEKKERFGAVVVGSGPAGLAVVGNLLEQKKGTILWVDDANLRVFGGGRLHRAYRAVPSNTKVKFFTMFADALEPFRQVTGKIPPPNPYSHLKQLDQERTCKIKAAVNLGIMLAQGFGDDEGVLKLSCRMHSASWSNDNHWNVKLNPSPKLPALSASSDLLFLCTGSHPTRDGIPDKSAQGIVSLDLDTCLNPKRLKLALNRLMEESPKKDEKFTIAVIGASHSAILVLRNIYNLAANPPIEIFRNIRIKWLTRHELRYAEERDGWIKRDNTGLKGDVAIWAKGNLEIDKLPTSQVSKCLEKVKISPESEQEDQDKHLQGCDCVVHAIGFTKNDLPVIERDGTALEINYDHETSGFVDAEGKIIRGLYGAGIAFPEKVVDPEGTTEYAVGLWKFMKYLKRVAPTWTA